MFWFAQSLLIAWPLVVLIIFKCQPLQRALVTSFVASWLVLPPISLMIPGVPDWSKEVAGVIGVTLGVMLTRPDRFLSFRPRWFDLPVFGFCVCSFPSALLMGFGPYEGLSSVLDDTVRWGLPYLIGRTCLGDRTGLRQLALGVALGGLLYVPLCLVEIQNGPYLRTWIYGIININPAEFGLRYGGFRPAGFLSTGLELGWWMCCASLCSYLLLASRATRRWFGFPALPLAWVLAVVTVACKSTGALMQGVTGVLVIQACRLCKQPLPFWILLSIAPIYCVGRSFGLMSSDWLGGQFRRFFSADRMQSFEFRLAMEDYLFTAAWQHPILGWTRNSGYNPVDATGQSAAITDGYWILVLCNSGFVGLTLFNAMILLPSALFLKRYPVRTWMTPEVAPLLALALILPLFMIDNLSNAMPNPIYVLAMGALSGVATGRLPLSAGIWGDQDGGRLATTPLVEAIRRQEHLVRSRPFGRNLIRLALLRVDHARDLARRGHADLALGERTAAEALWVSVGPGAGLSPEDAVRAANANDLAWLLVVGPTADPTRYQEARHLADTALAADPDRAPYWNTLGIICFRLGDYHRAIQALSRSVSLGAEGGTAFDYYFLALANQALGYQVMADGWLERATDWRQDHPELDSALEAIQADVVAVTGLGPGSTHSIP